MSAVLSPVQEEFISRSLQNGEFQSRKELLDRAVDLLMKQRELRGMIQAGIDQLDRGEGIPAEEVHAWLDQEFEQLARQPAP